MVNQFYTKLFGLLFLLTLFQTGISQEINSDSLRLTLPAAEKLFLQNNLSLIAQRYNVDINKALVQQAKYWDNPNISIDQNLYDGKFFRHKTEDGIEYGQWYVQVQQLIKTAGKRNKLVKLANDNVLSTQQLFNDDLRNLRYILSTDFNTLYQFLQTYNVLNNEIEAMQRMVEGMDAQLKVGNISQKDNVRVKALLYSLQSDRADVLRQITDVEREIKTVLRQSDSIFLVPILTNTTEPATLGLTQLVDSARINRPDLQLSQTNLLYQQHNLSYQKALAVPDLAIDLEYDKANSYVPDYWGLGVNFPLPIFNRNKGNINAAKISIKQAQTGVDAMQNQLDHEVAAAYNKWLIAKKMNEATVAELGQNYDKLMSNMVQSYQQRQVSLIEFIDFFDAYRDSKLRQFQQQANLRNAAAELNFTTATNLIPVNP